MAQVEVQNTKIHFYTCHTQCLNFLDVDVLRNDFSLQQSQIDDLCEFMKKNSFSIGGTPLADLVLLAGDFNIPRYALSEF